MFEYDNKMDTFIDDMIEDCCLTGMQHNIGFMGGDEEHAFEYGLRMSVLPQWAGLTEEGRGRVHSQIQVAQEGVRAGHIPSGMQLYRF